MPVLPVVAETDAAARAIVDRLLLLVPLDDDAPGRGFPATRSLAAFLDVAGIAGDDRADGAALDAPVDAALAARFAEPAARTLALVEQRTGRRLGGERPSPGGTSSPRTPCPPPSSSAIRDRSPTTSSSGATRGRPTGSTCSRPSSRRQFEAFTRLAAPELRRRGLLGRAGETLRERLGVGRRASCTTAPGHRAARHRYRRDSGRNVYAV